MDGDRVTARTSRQGRCVNLSAISKGWGSHRKIALIGLRVLNHSSIAVASRIAFSSVILSAASPRAQSKDLVDGYKLSSHARLSLRQLRPGVYTGRQISTRPRGPSTALADSLRSG